MERWSFEIKANCVNLEKIEKILQENDAEFLGTDHQLDTYFNVSYGRMKLREGNIENHLIHYFRENKQGPKRSEITLFKNTPQSSLKIVLEKALGVMLEVDKERKIYFIENVKFHLDQVEGLGSFIEIEALDKSGGISEDRLKEQCYFYMDLFGIEKTDLIESSYSDMLLSL